MKLMKKDSYSHLLAVRETYSYLLNKRQIRKRSVSNPMVDTTSTRRWLVASLQATPSQVASPFTRILIAQKAVNENAFPLFSDWPPKQSCHTYFIHT
jgi:hypothetical protein